MWAWGPILPVPSKDPTNFFLSLSSMTDSSVQGWSLRPTSRPLYHHQLSALILHLPLNRLLWESSRNSILPLLLFPPQSTAIKLPLTSFHWPAHIKVTKDWCCQSQGQLQASLCWVLHRTEHGHFLILETHPLLHPLPLATPWGFFTGSKDFSMPEDPGAHPQLLAARAPWMISSNAVFYMLKRLLILYLILYFKPELLQWAPNLYSQVSTWMLECVHWLFLSQNLCIACIPCLVVPLSFRY